MTILYSDPLTYANGALVTANANFSDVAVGGSVINITSNNAVTSAGANDAFCRYTAVASAQSKQYITAVMGSTFTTGGVGAGMGIGLMWSTSGAFTGIRLIISLSGWEVLRFNTGTPTSLGSAATTTWNAADTATLVYDSSTGAVLVQKNGATVTSGSFTDGSPLPIGHFGIAYSSVANTASGIDAIEYGDFLVSGTQAPMMPKSLRLGGSGLPRFTPPSGGAGPVQYLQSVAGTLNFAGGLVKQVGKITAGTVNFAGALLKRVNKIVAGSVNFAGALAATRVVLLAVSGSVGFAGAITMRTLKNTAGSVNFAGGLLKQTNKLVAGSVNFAGGLIKRVSKLLDGAVSFTGTLATTKVILLSISGSLNFSGGLTKQTNKLVAGSVNFAGACKKAVSHAVSGTVNFSGGLLKQVNKLTAGAVSFVGSLATLKIPGGTTFFQNVGGTLSFIGTLATNKIPFGAVVSDWIMRIRRRRR